MPAFDHGPTTIHYDDEGRPNGFPVLLIAPGGMRSANELWNGAPWNPRTALAADHRVIGMDQRNAGRSHGPISGETGWDTYRDDQLALLDHLGIDRCHVVGMCIGGPYVLGLLQAAPDRFASAVALQPVGIDDNRDAFYEMFDQWVGQIAGHHRDVTDEEWRSFRSNMWDGDFVLTASPDDAARVTTPMLVAMGDDLYHPRSTSLTLADRAPNATLVEQWKTDDALPDFDAIARDFLARHTP